MKCEHSAATIVLLGSFQPDDFLPKRLVEKKIISAKDGAAAEFQTLISGQAIQYQLPWATLLITTDRFQIITAEIPFVRICDLTRKAIVELDTEVSITAMGINVDSHYDVGDFRERDKIAQRLAPPDAWGGWGRAIKESMQIETEDEMSLHGGLMSQLMRLPFRLDVGLRGWRDVTIEPSKRIAGSSGIYLKTNHHHTIDLPELDSENDDAIPTFENDEIIERFLTRLDACFDASILEAEEIFKGILGL